MPNDDPINLTEDAERAHLKRVTSKIAEELDEISRQVAEKAAELLNLKSYLNESEP